MDSTYHEAIASYFDSQADWRSKKAAEYPDDTRNAESEAALRRLAAYVRNLPADERIRELGSMAVIGDWFSPGEEGRRLISAFGFHNAGEHYDALLDELVPATVRDMLESGRLGGVLDEEEENENQG